MNLLEKQFASLNGQLLVSCQTSENDAFADPSCMARFARAAVEGGAAGIRANGADEIKAIREAVSVPIVGIHKVKQGDGRILITPSFESAQQLVQAGASLVALDCTSRGQRWGAFERLRRIQQQMQVPVLADIATIEEAVRAAEAGADAVLSTLRGYTPETSEARAFNPQFIAELVRAVNVPVIAEGRVETPVQACQALEAGAYAVIVGTAITRPALITRRFVSALGAWHRRHASEQVCVGVDLGGTNTKYGLVSGGGELLFQCTSPTPWSAGREALLGHLRQTVAACLDEGRRRGLHPGAVGIATAGWVNPDSGEVVYATENLPGWTGTPVGASLRQAFGLPVAVENDANALAAAEKAFGAAKDASNFVCITLGTGVGGGCYVDGRLNRGSHYFANALGHIPIDPGGRPCTCGLSGCLEAYTNAAALMRYAAAGHYTSSEQVISAAHAGDAVAEAAIKKYASYLAAGLASIVMLLDPEMLILDGGLAQNNQILVSALNEELEKRLTVWRQRKLEVQLSPLGYSAGVLGAAALAAMALK